MEHNYELKNLTVEEAKTLDALFLLKDALVILEPSKPVYVVPVTYTKGWTINYVETSIDTYKEIWALGAKLKTDDSLQIAIDEGLQVFNYKATKDYTEYAVVCNGIMYTFSDENKSYFANVFMRGNNSIISYDVSKDIKTKEEVALFKKLQNEKASKLVENIAKIKTMFSKINIKIAEAKLPLHLKYKIDEEAKYIDATIMYKDLKEGFLTRPEDLDYNWEDIYSKRRVFYSLSIREFSGTVKLHSEIRKLDSNVIQTYIDGAKLLATNMYEFAKLVEIFNNLAEENGVTFKV